MLLAVTFAGGVAGALIAHRIRLPGGLIVGSMLGTAAVTLSLGAAEIPFPLYASILIGVGAVIGILVSRRTIRTLLPAIVPSFLAAALIIVAGIGIAFLLRMLDVAPAGDMLATSPGALSVMIATSTDLDLDPAIVAMFHVVRLTVVLLTLPVLFWLLPRKAGSARRTESPGPARMPPGPAPRPSRRQQTVQKVMTIVVATGVGLLMVELGQPGGLVLGAMLGAAAVTVAFPRAPVFHRHVSTVVQVAVGWIAGIRVTPDDLETLQAAFLPAVLSAVLLVIAGIGITLLMRAIGWAPAGDMLATSPGGMDALVILAAERETGAPQVALFHTVRLFLVMVTLPILLALLR